MNKEQIHARIQQLTERKEQAEKLSEKFKTDAIFLAGAINECQVILNVLAEEEAQASAEKEKAKALKAKVKGKRGRKAKKTQENLNQTGEELSQAA
jgi:hypothetical protein